MYCSNYSGRLSPHTGMPVEDVEFLNSLLPESSCCTDYDRGEEVPQDVFPVVITNVKTEENVKEKPGIQFFIIRKLLLILITLRIFSKDK